MLGEVGDTFSGTSYSGGDKECRGLLDADGGGTMGAVRYPRLHISLPVRHGTDAATLEKSAGHLYGTSLPVGGESTHAVVAAHRGLADKLMFTNLGLAKKGDLFEIDVQGERLRYEVANIRVTGPDDVRPLAIEKGRDLVTLYTCTPYGVNTQRLLVTGERTDAPSDGNPGPVERLPDWLVPLVPFPGRGLFHRSLGRRIMKRDISEWLGVVLLLLGGLTLSAPFVLQAIDSAGQTASAEAAALPTPDGRRMIEEAKA